MGNPATRFAAALALAAGGFSLGVMVGQRRTSDEPRPRPEFAVSTAPAERSSRNPAASARTESETAATESVALRERVRLLEVELQTFRNGPVRKPAVVQGRLDADQVLEDLLALESGGVQDPDQLRSMLDRISKLDAVDAQTFINRFRNPHDPKTGEKKAAMQLALWAGGPESAAFIHVLLNDASLDPSLHDELLRELGPKGGGLFSARRLPVDEGLASTAMTLVRSDKVEERRAGAGLLGGVATPAARLELLRILAEERDSDVKLAAIRSLSYVGDPATRKTLEPYAAQTADPALQKAAAAAIKELDKGPR